MRIWVMLLGLFLILPLASASIFIEPLERVYNYGDTLTVETKIVPPVGTSAHYVVDLRCGANISLNIYNTFLDLPANIERPVTITTQLINPLLDNMTAPCTLRATYASETMSSSSFTMSKKINVQSELDFEDLAPGRQLSISGTAIKESGAPVNGFVEVYVSSLNLYKSSTVVNGAFNMTIMLPADAKSGKHNITLSVHNTDYNSRKINFGSISDTFTVSQVLKRIEIVAQNENVQPDTDFTFRIDALDQANDPIIREVSIIVNEPKGIPFIKKIVKSGENQILHLHLNNSPGYWSIETNVDGMNERKLFYLSEIQRLQTSLINDTLLVTNIGNSPFNGPLEITIGSHVEVKQIRLGVGETQKFTLQAPDGEYSIAVSEGGETEELGTASLTGNAVKVTDLREDVIGTITNPIIWWLAIALLVLIIVLVQIKVRSQARPPTPGMASEAIKLSVKTADTVPNPFSGATPSSFTARAREVPTASPRTDWSNRYGTNSIPQRQVQSFAPISHSQQPQPARTTTPDSLFQTENHGIRERAVAIALYVGSHSTAAAHTLNSGLSLAQEVGAKIYVDGDHRIILFSPRLTRNIDNEPMAINLARRLQALFLEHNRNYNDKIMFGIGITDGQIISEIEGNKFHFTSIGNLISYAKRLAQSANMKLLVSESIRRKVITTVKTERTQFEGIWEVVRVSDRSGSNVGNYMNRFSS